MMVKGEVCHFCTTNITKLNCSNNYSFQSLPDPKHYLQKIKNIDCSFILVSVISMDFFYLNYNNK